MRDRVADWLMEDLDSLKRRVPMRACLRIDNGRSPEGDHYRHLVNDR